MGIRSKCFALYLFLLYYKRLNSAFVHPSSLFPDSAEPSEKNSYINNRTNVETNSGDCSPFFKNCPSITLVRPTITTNRPK